MTRTRYCLKCDTETDHAHIDLHHRSRIEGNEDYQQQILKDREAGLVQAADKREKLP